MSRFEVVDPPPDRDEVPAPLEESDETTNQILCAIGAKIRDLRTQHGMTLQKLGSVTNLSPSMLSLVERGRASPSIGSLIAIAQALGATLSHLLQDATADEQSLVVRGDAVNVVRTSSGLLRRILRQDHARGVTLSVTEYPPSSATAQDARAHDGYEHGYVISGELTVDVDGVTHNLKAGDLISYDSLRPHRISNRGAAPATALWFNLQENWFAGGRAD